MSKAISFVADFLSRAPGIGDGLRYLDDIILAALRTGPVPKHVAFIMDGNRRFAKSNNIPLEGGHSAGARTLVTILGTCFSLKIEEVSVYAFSIENFNRKQEEVDTLFTLLRDRLTLVTGEQQETALNMNEIRVRLIGNRSMVPEDILRDLEAIEEKTKDFKKGTLNICAPYTSRDEICHSIQKVSEGVTSGELDKEKITPKVLEDNFYYGPDTNHVDILVRTSGHMRLSDYLLWQCNEDSAIYFTDTLWPDFSHIELLRILANWSFHKFLQLSNGDPSSSTMKKIDLKSLDSAPPLASVTKR